MSGYDDLVDPIDEELDLLGRHIRILKAVKQDQPIGLSKLSEKTGIPTHKVRYSLRLLQNAGIIDATPDGAVVTGRYDEFMESLAGSLGDLHEKTGTLLGKL